MALAECDELGPVGNITTMTYEASAIAEHIRAKYGKSIGRTSQFTKGRVNSSFFIEAEDGLYVFRVYERKAPPEVACEISILEKLGEHNFPSQRVIRTLEGEALSTFAEKPALFLSFLEGEPAPALAEKELSMMGTLMARMHVACGTLAPCSGKPTWEPRALTELFVRERENFLDSGVRHVAQIAAFFDVHAGRFSFPADLPQGVTHQDMKRENVIVYGGEVSGIIDFDNAYIGSFLHDIMTSLIWGGYEGDVLNGTRCRAFLDGYQTVRELTTGEKDSFIAAFRHRLLREVFIGPYAAVSNRDTAADTSLRFMELFERFGTEEERVLLGSLSNEE